MRPRNLATPSQYLAPGGILTGGDKEVTTKEHFNFQEAKLSRQKAPRCSKQLCKPSRSVSLVSSDPGKFVLSGNGIVFSGKNELITDAACANYDNLLCSKITSLPPPTDDAPEIIG